MAGEKSNAFGAAANISWLGEGLAPAELDGLAAAAAKVGAVGASLAVIVDDGGDAAALVARVADLDGCRVVVQPLADGARALALLEAGADAVCLLAELAEPSLVAARAVAAASRRQRFVVATRLNEHLRACIDTLPMPIFFKDVAGVYLGCNKAFLNFLGRSPEEVIGRTAAEVSPPDLARIYKEADSRVARLAEGVEIYEALAPFADGTRHDILFHKSAFRDASGEVAVAGAMFDITDRKRLEAQLTAAAERDALTGLFNRRKFFELAGRARAVALSLGEKVSALVMDLDWFKSINDRNGHAAGDFVLQRVADIIRACLRPRDILARAGGEEFYALLPEAGEAAVRRAEEMRAAIAAGEFVYAGQRLKVTASIGVAEIAAEESLEQALASADAALYRAKEWGRNRVVGGVAA